MKNLIFLALAMFLGLSTAQAQYEGLVEQKLERLGVMETRVTASVDLGATDKAWALGEIADSKMILIESSQSDLEELQAVEQAVNETCALIADRVLAAKKAKLMGRIARLDAMIEQYQLEGLDTTELEALSDVMKVQVEGL